MQKITTFLTYNNQAEEAAALYTSIFKNSKILTVSKYGDGGPGPKGSVMAVTFELEGQEFFALNGGPQYSFTPAISFFVSCQTQDEVDTYWDKLLEGGLANRCGWLTDKFGLTWQIVPAVLTKMLQDKDAAKSNRVMKAMMGMVKLDIAGLQRAYDGTSSIAA